MGFILRIFIGVLVLGTAILYKKYNDLSKPLPIPDLDLKAYWGPGPKSSYKEDTSIRPFTVSIPDTVITKLQQKLEDTAAFAPPLEEVNFEYGFNTNELPKVISYWRNNYLSNWKKRESYLNSLAQFKTKIQGLDIHFIHVKPKVAENVKVYPMILLHGWPGSVREFYELIPKLTTKSADKDFVFEVIVPSLPGYGWSQPSSKKGMGTVEMAVIMKNLMTRLGHKKFYVQGGDWGSVIGSNIAAFFPEHVLGYHGNMCMTLGTLGNIKTTIASFYPSYFIEDKYIDWYFPIFPKFKELIMESGYMHIQATKPDTIGAVLTNNPAGLAAYILEKFSTWTNPSYRNLADGGLIKYFTLDALLDNIMIYYLSDSITTSQRLYYEAFSLRELGMELERVPIKPPSACARFKYELSHQIDWVLRDKYVNLVQLSHLEDGGHFAAMQLPNVMYQDIVNFVKKTLT